MSKNFMEARSKATLPYKSLTALRSNEQTGRTAIENYLKEKRGKNQFNKRQPS